MKKSNYFPFKLTNYVSITLKCIVLFIGLNIILTTFFVLIKEQIRDNFQKETSYLSFKYMR